MRHKIILALSAALVVIGLSACGGANSQPATPAGDAVKGQATFQRGCASCHNTSTQKLVGPGLAGLFDSGGPTLPDGVDYGGKLPNGRPISDENVAAWIKSGGQGKIGVMPAKGLATDMTDQDITNLIAYLKTLKK